MHLYVAYFFICCFAVFFNEILSYDCEAVYLHQTQKNREVSLMTSQFINFLKNNDSEKQWVI